MPADRRIATHAMNGLLIAAALFAFSGCAHRSPGPDIVAQPWRDAGQLVLVTTDGWNADHGRLRTFERGKNRGWRQVGEAAPVVIGRAGAAWGLGLHAAQPSGPVKREGDGRAPAGVFGIGHAFGYAARAETALPYTAMDASDYCIDVSDSPLYNRIVDAGEVGEAAVEGSTEPMRRDIHADGDQRYRLGFVVEHNLQATPMAGSCIFAHLWKSPATATAGCTAMDDAVMRRLLGWLRPQQRPVFVLLPQAEHARLKQGWGLPPL